MKPTIRHLCGCRDPETKRIYPRGACPKLSQRGHGFWEWRVRVPKELVVLRGKPEEKGREASKKAAEGAAEKAIAEIRAGQQHTAGLTVGTYLTEQWLPGKRSLRPSAWNRYEQFCRLYLVPYLGEIPLAGLRVDHIDRMFRKIEETNHTRRNPVGPATLGDIRDCLRAALNHAMRQRLIAFSPAAAVEVPEHETPEVEPWEAEEVAVFLEEAAGERLAVLYRLAALHGLRRGELCGARWPDLDDLTAVLRIRQQITDSGGKLGVWPPKTKSSKGKVDIDAGTLTALAEWHEVQETERAAVGRAWGNGTLPDQHGNPVHLTDLIFTRPDGQHLDPQWVTRRMQQIARRAGLLGTVRKPAVAGDTEVYIGTAYGEPSGSWLLYVDREPVAEVEIVASRRPHGAGWWLTLAVPLSVDLAVGAELGRGLLSRRRLHDLRHSSASIQLAEGFDIALVSKRLRHSSPSITGKIYAHLLRSVGQAAAASVASAVDRGTPRAHPVPIGRSGSAAPIAGNGENDCGTATSKAVPHVVKRRRTRDSNPRGVAPNTLSKRAP